MCSFQRSDDLCVHLTHDMHQPRRASVKFAKLSLYIITTFALTAWIGFAQRKDDDESVPSLDVRRDFDILPGADGCYGAVWPNMSKIPESIRYMEIVIAGHEFELDFDRSYLWELKIYIYGILTSCCIDANTKKFQGELGRGHAI